MLGAAHTTSALQYAVTYAVKSTGAVASGRGSSNGTTDVDIVAAPSSGDFHLIKQITVYNADTVSQTVTIKIDVSGTDYVLFKSSVPVGATLFYSPESGFQILQPSTIGASFGAARSASLTVASSTWTEIVFASVFDTHGWYSASSGRFTPQRAGKYRFSATLGFDNLAGYADLAIAKNSGYTSASAADIVEVSPGAVNSNFSYSVSGLMSLNGSSDYVSVWVWAADEATIKTNAKYNAFFGEWVGD